MPRVPYFVTLGYKQLLVGVRSNWTDYTIAYSLRDARVDLSAWHHLAVAYADRSVTVVLDGVVVAQGTLAHDASGGGNDATLTGEARLVSGRR